MEEGLRAGKRPLLQVERPEQLQRPGALGVRASEHRLPSRERMLGPRNGLGVPARRLERPGLIESGLRLPQPRVRWCLASRRSLRTAKNHHRHPREHPPHSIPPVSLQGLQTHAHGFLASFPATPVHSHQQSTQGGVESITAHPRGSASARLIRSREFSSASCGAPQKSASAGPSSTRRSPLDVVPSPPPSLPFDFAPPDPSRSGARTGTGTGLALVPVADEQEREEGGRLPEEGQQQQVAGSLGADRGPRIPAAFRASGCLRAPASLPSPHSHFK